MLGEKVGTFTGTTTDKVMPAQGGLPSFETSAQTSGKLAGAECQSMATYSAQMQPDGSLYGECPNSGVVMTSDGVATFRASGCGQMTGDGGAKFRGAVYFQTSAPSLMSVNGKCMVYSGMWMGKETPHGIFGNGSKINLKPSSVNRLLTVFK